MSLPCQSVSVYRQVNVVENGDSVTLSPQDMSPGADPRSLSPGIHTDISIPHVGYINPAYSHLSVPSRSASLLDLNLDKLSLKSHRWEDGSLWDGQIPMGHDSGLQSLSVSADTSYSTG